VQGKSEDDGSKSHTRQQATDSLNDPGLIPQPHKSMPNRFAAVLQRTLAVEFRSCVHSPAFRPFATERGRSKGPRGIDSRISSSAAVRGNEVAILWAPQKVQRVVTDGEAN